MKQPNQPHRLHLMALFLPLVVQLEIQEDSVSWIWLSPFQKKEKIRYDLQKRLHSLNIHQYAQKVIFLGRL